MRLSLPLHALDADRTVVPEMGDRVVLETTLEIHVTGAVGAVLKSMYPTFNPVNVGGSPRCCLFVVFTCVFINRPPRDVVPLVSSGLLLSLFLSLRPV